MIVTKKKSLESLVAALAALDAKKLYIVGCGQCATAAETGGEAQVRELADALAAEGFEIVGSFISESACHVSHVALEIRRAGVEDVDAFISLSCGSGVQSIADTVPEIPVLAGLDSLFIGNTLRRNEYEERCRACGQCGVSNMGGICPVAGCPKGILNGPCGAMWDGMCEVMNRPCVHVAIYERLALQGRTRVAMAPAKDNSIKAIPGKISRKDGEA